jgi:transposase
MYSSFTEQMLAAAAQVLAFFATLPPCVVAMEACGGAHFWARELVKLGHDVSQASERGLHDATGRYAVRKAGFTSVQRAASARAPGLNLPP